MDQMGIAGVGGAMSCSDYSVGILVYIQVIFS